MASQLTPTTLGGLEFNDIKRSLTDYLRTQTLFDGYNFEGSALQTVIDLLAYNTFYYAYYANMINAEAFLDSAQKTSSMISLCKPLGFTVPDRTCSIATIQISSNTDGRINAGTAFTGKDSDGRSFNFYNLEDQDIVDGQSQEFIVHEGQEYIEFDALPSFDFTNQRISIADNNFDLSTIKITITETLSTGVSETNIWTRLQNVGYVSQSSENIYFVERTSTGFGILFGVENSLGRQITTSVKSIKVRYLTTNGSSGNGISAFTSPTGTITTVNSSSNGRNAPDLDDIRFLAPKWFASQERAVTVNDYKALLLEAGFFNTPNDFNVFGGQDLTPPKYGRVFVTSNKNPDDPDVIKIINFLKERSIITVFPEYVTSNPVQTYVDFVYRLGNTTANTTTNQIKVTNYLRNLFATQFAENKKYNVEFSAENFIEYVGSDNVGDADVKNIVITPEDFNIYFQQQIRPLSNTQEFLFNLNNEFSLDLGVYTTISTEFDSDYSPGNKCVLKMYTSSTQDKYKILNLQLWTSSGTFVRNSGYFIVKKGVLSIQPGTIKTGSSVTLTLDFVKKNVVFSLNNLTTLSLNNITVI
jgi:hypothetical protein